MEGKIRREKVKWMKGEQEKKEEIREVKTVIGKAKIIEELQRSREEDKGRQKRKGRQG